MVTVFLTGGVFECDIARRRSAAVVCMLYKIRYNPMRSVYVAQPMLYMPVWDASGALLAHSIFMRLFAAEPRSTPGHLFLSAINWMILMTLHSAVWDWRVSWARQIIFYWPKLLDFSLSSTDFPFFSFWLLVVIVEQRSFDWYGVNHSLPPCITNLF